MIKRLLLSTGLANATLMSHKRGLCFVPNENHPEDNKIWTQNGSDLTWYYNYGSLPSPAFSSLSQDAFEFVPMMWGVNADNLNDTTFLDDVRNLIDSGTNITHVLGFNEPDAASTSGGGSSIAPADAAVAWVANFEPLAKIGVNLGLPACTGGWDGLPWLKQFIGNCSNLISTEDEKKNCTWDFLPIHWYDNLEGLESHIQERRKTWPETPIWLTEYAYANQPLPTTQIFYNESTTLFDNANYILRYSYFGAFRSDQSNVGSEAAFLSRGGELTEIGARYLGLRDTGVDPQSEEGSLGLSGKVVHGGVLSLALILSFIIIQ